MSTIALITNGQVTNVVLGDLTDFPGGRLVAPGERVSPGDGYVNGQFVAASVVPADPVSPEPLTQLAFLRRFTAEERIAIRASTDPVVQDFLHLLGLAQEIRLDDYDTMAGVGYLESLGLLDEGRTAVVLG